MNLNFLKAEPFSTNNVLRALTAAHLYGELEETLRSLNTLSTLHVTYPQGEAGLTDFDVPPAKALALLLDQARELYVNGPDVESDEAYHEVVDYDLMFREGLVSALRVMADRADELRVRASRVADLVAETYQGKSAEECPHESHMGTCIGCGEEMPPEVQYIGAQEPRQPRDVLSIDDLNLINALVEVASDAMEQKARADAFEASDYRRRAKSYREFNARMQR